MNILTFFLDLIFPIFCVGCKREGTHCCASCFEKIPRIRRNAFEENIFAASPFEENSPLAHLIHRYKYDGAKEIGKFLTALLPAKPPACFEKTCVLVPVPLHRKRKNWRGFNQSEVLTLEISKKWNIPTEHFLRRRRATKPQAELSREKRLTNLLDAFAMENPGKKLDPEISYILVDDVYTTGTTYLECAETLKRHGAQHVFGLVIARAL